jgi:glycosyltransferase involved in cell wall biosynthesis
MKVFAVIPAYNESKYVGKVVKGAGKHCSVIVVDDGSTDGTAELAERAGAKVLKLSRNRGKGYALRVGAGRALEAGADAVVFIDADQQHRTDDIPRLLEKLEDADAVFASRVPGNMPLVKRFGNWFLNKMFNVLFHGKAGDLLCGFRAFKTAALKEVMWKADGYSVEIEMAARAGMRGLKTARVEIPSIYLENSKGTNVMDGVVMAWNMLKIKLQLASEGLRH